VDERPLDEEPVPITGRVDLRESDYVAAALELARCSGELKPVYWGYGLLVAFALVVAGVAWQFRPGGWLVTVAASIGAIWFARHRRVWFARERFRWLPSQLRSFELTLSDAGVRKVVAKAEVRYTFGTLNSWVETEELWVFRGPYGLHDVIPKRGLDASDHARVRALFREHLPETVAKPRPTRDLFTGRVVLALAGLLLALAMALAVYRSLS